MLLTRVKYGGTPFTQLQVKMAKKEFYKVKNISI